MYSREQIAAHQRGAWAGRHAASSAGAVTLGSALILQDVQAGVPIAHIHQPIGHHEHVARHCDCARVAAPGLPREVEVATKRAGDERAARAGAMTEHAAAVTRTAALMADRSVPAIFEAAFAHSGVRVRVDVLERLPPGYWGTREVKSTGEVKVEGRCCAS